MIYVISRKIDSVSILAKVMGQDWWDWAGTKYSYWLFGIFCIMKVMGENSPVILSERQQRRGEIFEKKNWHVKW